MQSLDLFPHNVLHFLIVQVLDGHTQHARTIGLSAAVRRVVAKIEAQLIVILHPVNGQSRVRVARCAHVAVRHVLAQGVCIPLNYVVDLATHRVNAGRLELTFLRVGFALRQPLFAE